MTDTIRAIRVKARQSMVNYRTPTSFLIRETYPLPPYSTVVGMVHSVCGFESWRPMRVSVQGRTRGVASDMFIRYSFGNTKFEASRHQIAVPVNETDTYGVCRGVAHTELIVDIQLILHIYPDRKEDVEPILNGLRNPRVYPSLGRYEDLLDIEEVEMVEVLEQDEVPIKNLVYVPKKLLHETGNGCEGTVYRLHKEYEYDSKKRRRWKETIETYLLSDDVQNNDPLLDFPADSNGYPVAFA